MRTDHGSFYVPFSLTTDPLEALVTCPLVGLLRTKLDHMDPLLADIIYSTELAKVISPS